MFKPMMAQETSQQLLSLKRWRKSTFWVMLIGYIGYYLCRKNISAAFPLMMDVFGYSKSELGLIALYSEIAYAAGKFINGPLADRFGGKRFFLLGMVGAVLCNFAFSFGGSLPYFIIVWCVCRYFLSMGWGGLSKVIGNWYEPENNGTVMGLISINFQFGGVCATLLAGLIVAQGGTWQDLFIYPPLALIVILIWSALASKDNPQEVVPGTDFGRSKVKGKAPILSRETKDEGENSLWQNVLLLLKLPIFLKLLVFSFLTTFLRSVFFFWTPTFLIDLGMGTSNAIFKSALFPFLGALGTILLGWYSDRYAKNGDRAKMMWVMLCGLLLSLLTISWGVKETWNPSTIAILLGFSGFFLLGPYSMSSGCLALDIAGEKAVGSCTGLIDGLGYMGGALAVWCAGKLADMLGWSEVFLFLSLFTLFSIIAAFLMSLEFQTLAKKMKLSDTT